MEILVLTVSISTLPGGEDLIAALDRAAEHLPGVDGL